MVAHKQTNSWLQLLPMAVSASEERGVWSRLQLPAGPTPELVECLQRVVSSWRVDGANRLHTGTYRVQMELGPIPSAPVPIMPPGPRVTVVDAQGRSVAAGPVPRDLESRIADVQRCANAHPANVDARPRLRMTLDAEGHYTAVTPATPTNPGFSRCIAETAEPWRAANANRLHAGAYEVTMQLVPRPAPAPTSPTSPASPRPAR